MSTTDYQHYSQLELNDINKKDTTMFDDDKKHKLAFSLPFISMENLLDDDDDITEGITGNPKNWHYEQVKLWLERKSLSEFIKVFDDFKDENDMQGINGEELLDLTSDELYNSPYKAGEKLKINEDNALIERLFREIRKLELRSNQDINIEAPETKVNDLIEMKRRVEMFIQKWDKILWVEHYVETNNKLPTKKIISEELEVSESVGLVYIDYYNNIDRYKKKDLDELLLDFNVYNDAVIWWFIIIASLKQYPSKSMWLIFQRVAEITPSPVAIELLETYKFDLTRFPAHRLDKVCQNIVIGSQFPVACSLRISKWFNDRSLYDVARGEKFKAIAESYIEAAMDYISFIESDHLATILLEIKSDIDELSALDMALEYELASFVANNRVERITTSIMNNFEFLKPKNSDEAFEIDPLSINLVWRKMYTESFYLTPLGLYITQTVLYFCYLGLFSYLSIKQFRVYDYPMDGEEMVFWIFNAGYVINEIQQIISGGMKQYFSDRLNYFDIVISCVFITSMIIRCYAINKGPNCDTDTNPQCWYDAKLNTTFVILWGIATITLWVRLINFCVLSHKLGPMVQMIFRMMDDIITFFEIMLILFFGFSFALMFILGDVHSDFETPLESGLTLFRAILGDFDFGAFSETTDENNVLVLFGYGIMILYLIIGSLVLLNLLVAMMATTYEHIDANATEAIIFARFKLAMSLDTDPSFMPPPLNIFAMILVGIFYGIEWVIRFCRRCCCKDSGDLFDLVALIMPSFMRKRKLELDQQILWKNCNRYWEITTNKGATKCRVIKFIPNLHKHVVDFYHIEGGKAHEINVSVEDDVAKKHRWKLDLMHLYQRGLMKLDQFEMAKVDQKWTNEVYKARKEAKAIAKQQIVSTEKKKKKKFKYKTISAYWVCGYCRSYVKESNASIKYLGRLLHVNDVELKIINKRAPIVCPNCYRVRFERKRWELVWEVLSIWMYYFLVFPLFVILFGFVLLIRMIQDPEERGRTLELLKSKLMKTEHEIEQAFDIEDDEDDPAEKAKYVRAHYKDSQLIAKLNAQSTEHTFFQTDVRNSVWEKLYYAKDAIDPFLLKQKISNHVVKISSEDSLTPFEFYEDFVNSNSLKKDGGDKAWSDYFQPLSLTIFKQIHKKREEYLPLNLFYRYPFDVPSILDDLEEFFHEKSAEKNNNAFEKSLKNLKVSDLLDALETLQFLNCVDFKQRQHILESIDKNVDYKDDKMENSLIYHKFVKYLIEVSSLFQSVRKIKNLLRDANNAIIERGAGARLFDDQIYFLFDDIKNETVALPFFNSMRTLPTDGEELEVELWTVRNTLQTLYFLNNATRKYILENNKKIYVNEEEIRSIVFKMYENDIVFPDISKQEEKKDDEEDVGNAFNSVPDDLKMEKSDGWDRSLPSQTSLNIRKFADNEEDEQEEEERQIEEQKRMDHFYKKEITSTSVEEEIKSIFNKLKKQRELRVTETTIDYYRRSLDARLLRDDESLRYIVEQLARYATFHPEEIQKQCDLVMFKRILLDEVEFGLTYTIDEETIPRMVKNEKYIETLYKNLGNVFKQTAFGSKQKDDEKMHLQDVVSIMMIYHRIFSVVQKKIVDSADEFVVNHSLFCKFVDNNFELSDHQSVDKWSNKTRAASNLYQSVLDIQQGFVTLGQIGQTIELLLTRIDDMACGELIRLINHIGKQKKEDTEKCAPSENHLDALMEDEELDQEETEEKNEQKQINQSLKFKHINRTEWRQFIQEIGKSFHHDIKSIEIAKKLENYDEEQKEKDILRILLENTSFDIISTDEKDEIKEDNKQNDKEIGKTGSLTKARQRVFEEMLSFNSRRITVQQLYEFAKEFSNFLKENKQIDEIMNQYVGTITVTMHSMHQIQDLKKVKVPKLTDNNWSREIKWLYENINNAYDLCKKIYPFWSKKFINDIKAFLQSSKQVQGNYELKCGEFGQLKYSLNVDSESAKKLFHIIRYKQRSLSWKQIWNYFKFCLKIKYNTQKAILKEPQAEDTTISSDGMKILLKISSNDESNWLFNKVLSSHGSKVTWKQIIAYLSKMIAVREDMRDFFEDQERDRNYIENRAEIIHEIQDSVEDMQENKGSIMDCLKEMQQQIKMLNEKIDKKNANLFSEP